MHFHVGTFQHFDIDIYTQYVLLRIIGRIAFPIFAYSIYEGCRYTHHKGRYLLQIFGLGILCLVVYYLYSGEIYGNVLITFSLSILVLYSLQFIEKSYNKQSATRFISAFILFLCSIILSVFVCSIVYIEYGFIGVMLPVFAELFHLIEKRTQSENVNNKKIPLIGFALGLLILCVRTGGIQFFSMIALLSLAVSNGKKGIWNMKYFFYVFYPIHLLLIGLVSMLF